MVNNFLEYLLVFGLSLSTFKQNERDKMISYWKSAFFKCYNIKTQTCAFYGIFLHLTSEKCIR